MSAIELFQYETTELRTVIREGEPWFVAADVARILEYRDAHNLVRRLDDDDKGTHSVSTVVRGEQLATIISEAGFYAAILGSKSAAAKNVKRWLTHDVLPTIRKTGGYTAVPDESDDEVIHRALTITAKRVEALTTKVAELEPKAEFFDDLMDSNGLYSMEAVAKSLGYGRNILFKDLRRLGILQGNNLPYQRHAHHFKVIPGTYTNRKTGELVPTATTWVRPSGLDYLRRKLTEAPEAVQQSNGVLA